MYKSDMFSKFSTDNLKDMAALVLDFEGKDDLLMGIHSELKRREAEKNMSLNSRFTIEMFREYNMFYLDELRVLEVNGIRNLQDLIDCDLNSLVGITEVMKEKFGWARRFYNMDKPKENNKIKTKK